jgi:hypothetical protein
MEAVQQTPKTWTLKGQCQEAEKALSDLSPFFSQSRTDGGSATSISEMDFKGAVS